MFVLFHGSTLLSNHAVRCSGVLFHGSILVEYLYFTWEGSGVLFHGSILVEYLYCTWEGSGVLFHGSILEEYLYSVHVKVLVFYSMVQF